MSSVLLYNKVMKSCIQCGQPARVKFCSNACQLEFQYETHIKRWKAGGVDGSRGIAAKNLSGHLIRYLRSKYDACVLCGWNTPHPITGKVPLEIDHIDGNSENNTESNLRLICPNCHSLTSNFRNLNYGNGRKWRKAKYIKVDRHMPL